MIEYLIKMFLTSLILTIAIELVVILLLSRISRYTLFIHRKQGVFLVVLVNVLTNPLAVLICWLARLYLGNVSAMIVQLVTETAVVIVEAWIYHIFAKDKQWEIRNPFILSGVANICSWLCGIALMTVRDILI